MKLIPLTQGKVARVSDWQFERVAQMGNWHAVKSADDSRWYAEMTLTSGKAFMHHIILPLKPGYEIDHKDGDGLNNQDENLRYATRAQNARNRRILNVNNKSG